MRFDEDSLEATENSAKKNLVFNSCLCVWPFFSRSCQKSRLAKPLMKIEVASMVFFWLSLQLLHLLPVQQQHPMTRPKDSPRTLPERLPLQSLLRCLPKFMTTSSLSVYSTRYQQHHQGRRSSSSSTDIVQENS